MPHESIPFRLSRHPGSIIKTPCIGPMLEQLSSTVFVHNPFFKVQHLITEFFEFRREFHGAVVIGQISLVHFDNQGLHGSNILPHEKGFHQRLSDVIDLSAPILAFGVRKEGNGFECVRFRRNVYERIIGRLPNHVEFCFDQYARPFPDCPPDNAFSAVSDNLLFHDMETFIHWFANNRLDRYGKG
uniref:Uncharacterized protein n=1 Tax=Candidatus Kentrum sp. LFY TaxID=2126342 RepID=A0A450WI12_9GAMM|nr:MAG: hypothetical protein BECKLFY1418C_GA0070996_102515 [Candidatus Kentron sp. LFY]